MPNQTYFTIIEYQHPNYPFRIGKNTLKKGWYDRLVSGFYYTTVQHIFHYVFFGEKVYKITIPKDTRPPRKHIMPGELESEKIIIEKIMPLWDIKTIKYLVSLGADIHVRGEYLLRHAVYNGYVDIAQFLVSIGANVFAYDYRVIGFLVRRGDIKLDTYRKEYSERLKKMNLIRYINNKMTF